MKKKAEYASRFFLVLSAFILFYIIGYYVEMNEIPGLASAPCFGWEDGWKNEPELAGVAASIKASLISHNMTPPSSIEEVVKYGRGVFRSSRCSNMPKVSRDIPYPVVGWSCQLLPNGPPRFRYDREHQDASVALHDFVLLRCNEESGRRRQFDFVWNGDIVEKTIAP